MKNQKYKMECSKCEMPYIGTANYFRFDLKMKCFCGSQLLMLGVA